MVFLLSMLWKGSSCIAAGEQRQARGGCLADLVFTGEAVSEQPGSYEYTFSTASSLRADLTQRVAPSTQQASSFYGARRPASASMSVPPWVCLMSARQNRMLGALHPYSDR